MMKKVFNNFWFWYLLLAFLMPQDFVLAQIMTPGGGTGSTSPSGILIGVTGNLHLQTLTVGTGLTLTGTTLTSTGGGGTPGGLNLQVQYNNAGSFGGISGAVTNGTILNLTNPLLGGATLTTSSVNGVTLTSTGSATSYLNGTGAYSVPVGTIYTGTYPILVSGTTISTALSSSTLTASSPLTGSFAQVGTGGSLGCQTASGSQAGCLASADFTTFNNKQPAGNYITALTGDGTASGPGSVAFTLATVNGNIGTFNNVTINAKGLATAGSNIAYDTFAWPFTPINATSVATSSGLVITASSTIGNATQTTGLTISGGATTTLNSLVEGSLTVGTTTNNTAKLFTVEGNASGGIARFQRDFSATPATSSVGTFDALLNETGAATLANLTGPTQTFGISLGGGAENILGDIGAYRFGADNTGELIFRPYSAGVGVPAVFISPVGEGVGSSTPSATLSVFAANGSTNTTLFAIGSSTASATTTLFSVSNIGSTTLASTFGSCSGSNALNTNSTGTIICGAAAGGVSSVSNSDGTLTISPTTGAVVASIALAHVNVWTGLQTFNAAPNSAIFGNTVGIGTTSPGGLYQEEIASSTGQQLVLSDASTADPQWAFRNSGGTLYIGTSSPATYATSSTQSAIQVTSNTTTLFGIATTTPWRTLSVTGTVGFDGLTSSASSSNFPVCISPNKELVNSGNTTSCTLSSKFIKHDIEDITDADATQDILNLRPVSYVENASGEHLYGFIAEEVAKTDPMLAEYAQGTTTIDGHTFKNGDPINVDYPHMTAIIIKYLQDNASTKATRSVEENWQWFAIVVLFLGLVLQQLQLIKLKKK